VIETRADAPIVRMPYRIAGSGSAWMVSLSGFLYGSWVYDPLLECLGSEGFKFVLFENPGTAGGTRSVSGYDFGALCRNMLETLDQLGAERFWVMGYSMGGFLAQELVAAAPDRVLGTILMCTLSGGPAFAGFGKGNTLESLEAFYQMDKRIYVPLSASALFTEVFKERPDSGYAGFVRRQIAELPDYEQALHQRLASDAFLARGQDFSLYRFPVLILSGTKDITVDCRNSLALRDAIPGSRYVAFEGLRHFFFLEEPLKVAETIAAFIRDTPPFRGARMPDLEPILESLYGHYAAVKPAIPRDAFFDSENVIEAFGFDSLDSIRLINAVQDAYALDFSAHPATLEYLKTPRALAGYLSTLRLAGT
jgi:pimeloyl-ACP methyl ester carboxylesterase/acyl carrier protein